MGKLSTFVLPVCVAMLWSALAVAQRTAATLSGQVVDPSGAVVPVAHVAVTESDTGITTAAQVNAQGFYIVSNLEPGTYVLRVEATGFQGYEQTGIVIQVGQSRTVDVRLKVGATTAEVVVTGESPLVDTRSQTVSFAVTPQFTEDMPLDNRRVIDLIALAPDTSAHNPDANNYSSQIATRPETADAGFLTASGEARENSTAYYLDGGLNEDAYTDVANVFPNPDAVQEFTVDTNSYNAKFAGRGGAVVNAITKGGTNKIHGSAFEYLRNGDANASNYFAVTPDTLNRNQFGFSLGGPLVKDKTFWFGSFQRTTYRYGSTSNIGFGPTAAELKNGDWSAAVAPGTQLTNPFTGASFTGNHVPTSLYAPISLDLLALVPTGNATTGQFNYPSTVAENDNQFVLKVDHHVGDRIIISASYLWDRLNDPDIVVPGDILSGGSSGAANQVFTSQHATLNLTYRFGNNLLTTLGASLSRVIYQESGLSQFQNDSLVGLGANIPNWAPSSPEEGFYVGGWFTAYWNGALGVARNQTDITNNWTYIKGNHTLDFGGELPFYQSRLYQAYVSAGYQGWFDGYSGLAPLDFMLGSNDFYEQYAPSYVAPRGKGPALYANDAWRVRPRLTLNLGVRWEPFLPWPDGGGGKIGSQINITDYNAGIHSGRYPNLPAGFLVRGDPGVPNGLAPNDWKLLDPRVGLAWDVLGDGKTSVRAGFGIYHDQPFGRIYNEMTSTEPFTEGTVIQGPIIQGVPISAYNPYAAAPYLGNIPPLQNPPLSSTVFALPLGNAVGFSPDFQPPATMQWNLSVERQLGQGILLRTGYEASESYHMFDSRDINPAINGVRPMLVGGYGGPVILNESTSTASYNALVISAEKRMTGSLSFLGGFRWAKCIDEAGSGASFAFSNYTDPTQPWLDRGKCDSDLAEQFKLAAVWRTPTIKSMGFVGRQVLGGWTISGILSRHGGFPLTVLSAVANPDGDTQKGRANVTGDPFSGSCPNSSPVHTLNCWFNTSDFSSPAAGIIDGNSSRNLLRGPGDVNLDFALIKSFGVPYGPFAETQKIDFRAEAFNLPNHPNFGAPDGALGDYGTTFGMITSAYSPRVLQLALKYIF
jgi:hypothetical protein